MSSALERSSPWLFTIGLFALWELACRAFKIDKFILPAPSEAFAAMVEYWWPLSRHSLVTCGPRWRALASRSRSALCLA